MVAAALWVTDQMMLNFGSDEPQRSTEELALPFEAVADRQGQL